MYVFRPIFQPHFLSWRQVNAKPHVWHSKPVSRDRPQFLVVLQDVTSPSATVHLSFVTWGPTLFWGRTGAGHLIRLASPDWTSPGPEVPVHHPKLSPRPSPRQVYQSGKIWSSLVSSSNPLMPSLLTHVSSLIINVSAMALDVNTRIHSKPVLGKWNLLSNTFAFVVRSGQDSGSVINRFSHNIMVRYFRCWFWWKQVDNLQHETGLKKMSGHVLRRRGFRQKWSKISSVAVNYSNTDYSQRQLCWKPNIRSRSL